MFTHRQTHKTKTHLLFHYASFSPSIVSLPRIFNRSHSKLVQKFTARSAIKYCMSLRMCISLSMCVFVYVV